jgi:hypothetical protein
VSLVSILVTFSRKETSAGDPPLRPSQEKKSFIFHFMLYGRLLNEHAYRVEALSDFFYPAVLL